MSSFIILRYKYSYKSVFVSVQTQIKHNCRDVGRSGKVVEAGDAGDAREQHQEEHCRGLRGAVMVMMVVTVVMVVIYRSDVVKMIMIN